MNIYEQDCRTLDGARFNLRALRGQVLLIVNIATHCRFTPQLTELERLHQTYRNEGFMVLGFPCNQFARQSPEPPGTLETVCMQKYGVSFPLMEKVCVNGADTHPLFYHLRRQAPGVLGSTPIKWNFTKFLVGRHGQVIDRFGPSMPPAALEHHVLGALNIHFSA